MKRAITTTLLVCLALALPVLAADDALPLEQQLFNDFAGRLQAHLHKSAALLQKIRESENAQEREQLIKDYHQSMRTTMKIHHLMHQVAGGDDGGMGMGMKKAGGGMMKGKKMGGGMGCCKMMMGKKGGKQAAAAGDESSGHEGHGAASGESAEQEEAADSDEAAGGGHEGH